MCKRREVLRLLAGVGEQGGVSAAGAERQQRALHTGVTRALAAAAEGLGSCAALTEQKHLSQPFCPCPRSLQRLDAPIIASNETKPDLSPV